MDNSISIRKTRSRTGCFTCRKRKKKCDELLYPTCQNCQEKNLACQWPLKKHEFHKKLEEVKYIGYEDKKSKCGNKNSGDTGRKSAQQRSMSIEDEKHHKKRNQSTGGKNDIEFMPIKRRSGAGDLLAIDGLEDEIARPDDAAYVNSVQEEIPVNPEDSTPDSHDKVSSDLENYNQYNIRLPTDHQSVIPYRVSKQESIKLQRKRHNYFLERIAMQQDCVDSDEASIKVPQDVPFENHSLTDNDYILNDINNHDCVDRTKSPTPKADSKQSEWTQLQTAFPHKLTVSGSSLLKSKVPNSLASLNTKPEFY